MIKIDKADKILVVGPHPDDESLGCGGFMLKYAKQIDSFCFLSSGISPNAREKSDIRMAEWNEAQKFIGCNNLGIVELYGDKPLLPRIMDNMSKYLKCLDTGKYDYIFMPHLNDNHPEHKYISQTIMRKILLQNGYKRNLKICFYEVWSLLDKPNTYSEINADDKLKLLSLYKTQWSICDLKKKILGLNCYRGVDAGFKEYVEAFKEVSVRDYMEETAPVTEIVQNKKEVLSERIWPNFISNRYDLLYGDDFELYDLGCGVVPVKIEGASANVGMHLAVFPECKLQEFYELLFAKHPHLTRIYVEHSLSPYGIRSKGNQYWHYPYWHIELPESIELFDKALAARVRYNTKWYPKKIREDIGEFEITKIPVSKTTDDMVDKFFAWKKESHDCDYKMSAKEYLKAYGVTETYIMKIASDIVAIGFTCTTGENVYFEQFAYTQEKKYKKYSIGMVLYYCIICDLIGLKRKNFYLSGGWLDYKRRYNGICQYTYSGQIQRNDLRLGRRHHSFWWHLKHLKF